MDDLVSRLRARGWKVCNEAADELERLHDTLEVAARVADKRVALDQERYRHETDWRMPYAFNRVVRASMDIAAEIRAQKRSQPTADVKESA
jgi:hypothetical protein